MFPDSVKSIGRNAFSYCYSLTSITFPEGVGILDDFVLEKCYDLTSVTIENP